eukprot:CAMPEP_0184486822 /NCGR_PEP_ID=MMETSP0113_2-20130426/8733_1 /TAXON_ID=91329 /ORGANISM="Norrisiella sphaerica, Strain BC52" /LENGTH=87 /DNA_ID=CAMNT_0026868877 /DNA_START=279 /DNA_END=542 /DNA_ORIENTATION=-
MVAFWEAASVEDVTPENIGFIESIADIEVVIVGTGKRTKMLPPETIKWFRERKIGFEMAPSSTACATFNFMCEEKRQVVALILPLTA